MVNRFMRNEKFLSLRTEQVKSFFSYIYIYIYIYIRGKMTFDRKINIFCLKYALQKYFEIAKKQYVIIYAKIIAA